ncbi:NERD domain-containing protein (plasmid) [Polaromonas sp. P1-6]|nr:NERD domain-containing protein [Polaromonas sp. P1-6]
MNTNRAEAHAAELLTAAFKRTFTDVVVLTGLIVSLPKPSRIPTGEFDCIVVCNAGMFVFEVKGWKNCGVRRCKEGTRNRWFLGCKDRNDHEVPDPLVQGCEKLTGLKSFLDPRIGIRYYVLLPEEGVELDPTLPAGVITSQELPYIPRLLRSQTKASKTHMMMDGETVDLLARYLQQLGEGHTLEEHIENCQRFHADKKAELDPCAANLALQGGGKSADSAAVP